MARRFTKNNSRNGFAAMGNSLRRPRYRNATSNSVAASIERARAVAARQARISSSKKK